MESGFFGVGLPHLGMDVLIAMSNKLLMHYGCNTMTGQFMQALHSLFSMELGYLYPAPTRTIQQIQIPLDPLVDEDALEKNLNV
jgi:hypothetical protein